MFRNRNDRPVENDREMALRMSKNITLLALGTIAIIAATDIARVLKK